MCRIMSYNVIFLVALTWLIVEVDSWIQRILYQSLFGVPSYVLKVRRSVL